MTNTISLVFSSVVLLSLCPVTAARPQSSNVATEVAMLTPLEAEASDWFGGDLAIDGDTLVVGAVGDDAFQGAAYVFVDDGAGWTEQAKLAPVNTPYAYFGGQLALDADTIAVGAPNTGANGTAFVFTRDGDTWTQQAALTDETAGSYGGSVALSGDTLLVSSLFPPRVHVYIRNDSVWVLQHEITLAEGATQISPAVALDGNTALIGTQVWNGPPLAWPSGSVLVYERTGASWDPAGVLESGSSLDGFGHPLVVDGDTAVVGAMGDDSTTMFGGAAYVFRRTDSSWALEARLTSPAPQFAEYFGSGVDIDGDTLIVGARGSQAACAPDVSCSAGGGYLYERSGSSWSLTDTLVSLAPESFLLGSTVGLDADRVLLGSHMIDAGGKNNSGAVHAYQISNALVAAQHDVSLSAGGTLEHELAAGSTLAEHIYMMLGTASGTSPGTPLGSFVLPLNIDGYFLASMSSPIWTGGAGFLSGSGTAQAQLGVPAGSDPSLAGLTLHHAFAVLDPITLAPEFASNPVALALQP